MSLQNKPEKMLLHYRKGVDAHLRRFFGAQKEKVRGFPKPVREMMQRAAEFTLRGGKRLRPVLLILGYEAVSAKKNPDIFRAAIAVELMQSFLLIHDDIIDDDSLRRGKRTVHRLYEDDFRKIRGCARSEHLGVSSAILAGDLLAVLGTEVLSRASFHERHKLKAISKFNKVLVNTIFGQLMDTLSSISKGTSEADLGLIHRLKTAIYTIEGPLHIGALLAGASGKQLRQLSSYALPLGRAFQIKDDVLGMFGSERQLGKPVWSDVRQGKKTLLIVKALEKADAAQKAFIKRCLGNDRVSEKDMETFRKVIRDTGSLQYSQNLSARLAVHAKSALKHSGLRKKPVEALLWLADYIIARRS